ncbi:hypothetical protein [Mesorhizobium sp. M2C.T.Ca.TU.002.02.1.1]|uniref:hypothetical protein n=1 Tax=Mesorhizobium sp. M2C.T.Ca.TU.002.02.1.1 TaxID=2496788 RepID=UPI000FC9E144|nr:hypothetical protein [Mesorhizobium sp. M2C.T.Ca.TU.002.02.1.1]RUU61050.1 hypothetical protein EOD07_02235 [Mesorhizobium sp. M2C.T.Ca.TU.002.02.1.1]RUU71955.1 hypothetical protein EOD04_00685 [Mesorhizobium sp. M2C.T.Ca.TU.009.01.2.1]
MKQSDIDEALVALYLRLNGYFTSGLIVHSPIHGQATTEVDCLAIRLPHHAQPERVIEDDPFLDAAPGMTDVLICEVKSDPDKLSFNKPMKSNADALAGILNWTGAFEASKVADVAGRLRSLFDEELPVDQARKGLVEGDVRIRALLCCPPMSEAPQDRWRLTAPTILNYAEACFRPGEARPTCSVRYSFLQWGYPMREIVRWLKDRDQAGPASLAELYERFGDSN